MNQTTLRPATALLSLVLPVALTCCRSSSVRKPAPPQACLPYRYTLDVPDDLFARIHARMNEPFILAGEDASLLFAYFGKWLEIRSDREVETAWHQLPPDHLSALKAFARSEKFPKHPLSRAFLNTANPIKFPAQIAEEKVNRQAQ